MGSLKVDRLAKSYGDKTVFAGVSLEIWHGEKAGLIGANGCGKTTLIRCLLGLESPDAGQVYLPPGETTGYLEQDANLGQRSLYDELCRAYQHLLDWQVRMHELEREISKAAKTESLPVLMKEYATVVEKFEGGGGYEYQNNICRVASGLGFSQDDLQRSVQDFSGGQKTRICLARALIKNPDYLLLDEPTNHLDIQMIEWLEEYLTGYPGGVLIISHDRYFLNQVAGRILELENQHLTAYRGNYDGFLAKKVELVASRQRAFIKQQDYINRTEEYIRQYHAGIKSRQARGRRSQLERLDRVEQPGEAARVNFSFPTPAECAQQVAELDRVTAAYGSRIIFENLSLLIRRGERLALVGPNGSGKTTLIRLLLGELKSQQGRVRLGNRVQVGYYAQEHEGLDKRQRVIDELTLVCGLSEESARHYLALFLLRGDDIYKSISDLSGGETARLVILKLMLTGANLLILDEPTNHLDIPTKEALEEAILNFPGTFLIVSHDRYFLDRVANTVLELDNGHLQRYAGNYTYYHRKKAALQAQQATAALRRKASSPKAVQPLRTTKVSQQTLERQVRKLEQEISDLEASILEVEKRINDPASYTDPAAGQDLSDQYTRLRTDLDARYQEWERVASKIV
jgi:ATP-binding cassette subfamily F protein 3